MSILTNFDKRSARFGHRASDTLKALRKEVKKTRTNWLQWENLRANVLEWKKLEPSEFEPRHGRELLNAVDEKCKIWVRRFPTEEEFAEEISRSGAHYQSGALKIQGGLKNVLLSLKRFPTPIPTGPDVVKPREVKLSRAMDIEDSILDWIETHPSEVKARNGRSVTPGAPKTGDKGPVERVLIEARRRIGQMSKTADTFCVFNIGTSHSRQEKDNLLVRLFQATRDDAGQICHINHGPGHIDGDKAGGMTGHGLAKRMRVTVSKIKQARPKRVIIVGHSRGAVLSYLIAYEMKQKGIAADVHIFNVDPVAMTLSGSWKGRNTLTDRTKTHVIMAMENVAAKIGEVEGSALGGFIFPLTFAQGKGPRAGAVPYLGNDVGVTRTGMTQILTMPGSHGSATQLNTNIGKLGLQIVFKWLKNLGVHLSETVIHDEVLCDMFFEIHSANKITWVDRKAYSRSVVDDGKTVEKPFGRRKKVQTPITGINLTTLAWKKTTLQERISNSYRNTQAKSISTWEQHPLFINWYHERLFAKCWPTLHKEQCTGRAGRPTPPTGVGVSAGQVQMFQGQKRKDREWEARVRKLHLSPAAGEHKYKLEVLMAMRHSNTKKALQLDHIPVMTV